MRDGRARSAGKTLDNGQSAESPDPGHDVLVQMRATWENRAEYSQSHSVGTCAVQCRFIWLLGWLNFVCDMPRKQANMHRGTEHKDFDSFWPEVHLRVACADGLYHPVSYM